MEDPSDDSSPSMPMVTMPLAALEAMRELAARLREELKKCAETRAEVERLLAERTRRPTRRRKARRPGQRKG